MHRLGMRRRVGYYTALLLIATAALTACGSGGATSAPSTSTGTSSGTASPSETLQLVAIGDSISNLRQAAQA